MMERREEKRHVVPEIYRKYITLKVRDASGECVPVKLLDFSPKGIRIKCPYEIPVDSAIECLIAAPRSITKEIPFTGEIKYCDQDDFDGDYLIGAEITETSDRLGFEVFSEVHNFIKERMGDIF
ncbi:MAG TPA: PilZ domain-containing protein [Thermodesulfobacteriota bacterium]|nr:PilZ domain-containing protein [Thermodesulfobacteriota bacterium]